MAIIRSFNNFSIRIKAIIFFGAMMIFIQAITSVVAAVAIKEQLKVNIIQSNQTAISQIATNIDEIFINIIEKMQPIISQAQSVQYSTDDNSSSTKYIVNNVKYQELYNEMIASRNNFKFVKSMLVVDQAGLTYFFFSDHYLYLNGEDLFAKLNRDYGKNTHYSWSTRISESYYFMNADEDIVSIVVPIYLYQDIKSFVVVNLSVNTLLEYLDKIGDDQNIFLQISSGEMISNNALSLSMFDNNQNADMFRNINRKPVETLGEYFVITEKLIVNGWQLSLIYDYNTRNGIVGVLLGILIPLFVLSTLVLFISSGFVVSVVTKPLRKLIEIMKENGKNPSKNVRFNALYKDEFGVLGNTFNQMMDDIKKEQELNRINYMKMLQLQIKPHFLYNSMETTRFLVEMKDSRAIDMIRAIVKYYKFTLGSTRERVSIREEIDHTVCFLKILQIRYSSKFDFQVDVDPEILNNEIERFILQPLLENAVYHGIKNKRAKGLITITGSADQGDNIIVILDNGIGISDAKLTEINKKLAEANGFSQPDHIGIINVHERLKYRYGDSYGLVIDSVEGGFTKITVRIPVTPAQNANGHSMEEI